MTQPGEGGGVVITLTDIYRQLVSLTTRVDASLARQEQTERIVAEHEADLRPLAGTPEKVTDHEVRLRALERGRWPVQSVTILVALIALGAALFPLFK